MYNRTDKQLALSFLILCDEAGVEIPEDLMKAAQEQGMEIVGEDRSEDEQNETRVYNLCRKILGIPEE